MRQKRIGIMTLVIVMLGMLVGCGGKAEEDTSSVNKTYEKEKKFIFVCPILENEYWESCIEGIYKAGDELGVHTEVVGSKTADNFSVEIIEHMKAAVDTKPDGIIAYSGIEDMKPLIDQAVQEGIPVIAVDSDAPDSSRVAYVGSDTYNLGNRAGKVMVELTNGSAKIGVLVSSLDAQKEMCELEAFKNAIMDYNIEIVAIEEAGVDPDVAEEKSYEMLTRHPEITALFNTAGYNVTGAARTKKALGRDDLVLVGFDDVPENLEFIREGIIDAILVQSPEQMGYCSVYLLNEYLINGKLPVDNYDTGSILVTKQNVDSYYTPAKTVQGSGRVVRIGYYEENTSFQDGFSDEARKSGYAYEYYQALAKVANWQYEYVYGTRQEIMDLLESGDVDIVAGVYQTDKRAETALFSKRDMGLDGELCYFAVSSQKPDLLTELDSSIDRLFSDNPSFSIELCEKYYSETQIKVFSETEWQWIKSQDELRVGYVKHNLPYSEQDEDGNPTGLVKDLMDYTGSFTGLPVKAVCYETIKDMEEGLSGGEIDAAFPVYSDLWQAEQKNFRQTEPFISDRVMIIYDNEYTGNLMERVALSDTGIGQMYYFEEHYPDSEVSFYASRGEALDAILSGKERCMVGCSSILQLYMRKNPKYQKLNIAYLDSTEDFGMAVNIDNNILAGILDKVLYHLNDSAIAGIRMKYSGTNTKLTTEQFMQYYSKELIMVLGGFFAFLLFVFFCYWRREKVFNAQQEKSRLALEEALLAAKQASESKTMFLSSMSHDIRTPMNAITGMTSIALKHVDGNEKVEDCLNKIALSGRHLLTLINDVLDISKIESGKMVLNPVNFSLPDSISSLVNIVRPMVREKELEFDVHVFGMEYEMVYADEVRLNQVYVNLLTNAIKYTPAGGKIILELSETLLQEDGLVRLSYVVQDNGVGMSQEFMENMYEVFSRADDSQTTKIQGTGLGLAIVKRVVDLLGGIITCESEEGVGTRFTVSVDVPFVAGEEKPMLSDVSVLLVDDDEIFLQTASDFVSKTGAVVDAANGGEEALRIIREKQQDDRNYSVFIVDWKMTEMNGLETICKIQEIMKGKEYCILVSTYDWSEIEDEVSQCEVDGFVVKPIFYSYIYDKLREVLHFGEVQGKESEPLENDLDGLHLLIAEDNELNWEVVSELLEMYGISSDHAENGKKCLEMLHRAEPGYYALVLMDIQMPVMNGIETAKRIRNEEREDLRRIPIIAMTADAFAEDVAATLAVGMNGHVAKPVDLKRLLQEIRRVITSQPSVKP